MKKVELEKYLSPELLKNKTERVSLDLGTWCNTLLEKKIPIDMKKAKKVIAEFQKTYPQLKKSRQTV